MIQCNQHELIMLKKIVINEYLLLNLQRRKLDSLKPMQQKSLEEIQLKNRNVMLNSCTGSGKTLAYLLPMMNSILNQQDREETSQMHGGLILTLNKQLCMQIYREIRMIDVGNRLRVFRTGSIAHYSAIIDEKSKSKPEAEKDRDLIEDMMQANVAKTVQWHKTDILVSTPQMLNNMLTLYKHSQNQHFCPEFVAIDEADLLLECDKNVSAHTTKILEHLRKNIQSKGKKIKFILTASSFPKKMNGVDAHNLLRKQFHPLTQVEGVNTHKLPERIQLYYIDIKGQTEEEIQSHKLAYLQKIVLQRQNQRIIIFCHDKKHIQKVCLFLKGKTNQQPIPYYAGMDPFQRVNALNKFNQAESRIFVSSDLGSRGLDFENPIHLVLQYDMAENITNFINRAGRTARNQLPGQIITLVEQKNKFLFEHLKDLKSVDQRFDELFSRKRSYRKLYKPDNQKQE